MPFWLKKKDFKWSLQIFDPWSCWAWVITFHFPLSRGISFEPCSPPRSRISRGSSKAGSDLPMRLMRMMLGRVRDRWTLGSMWTLKSLSRILGQKISQMKMGSHYHLLTWRWVGQLGSNPRTVSSGSTSACGIECGSCHSSRSEFAGQCQWASGLSAPSSATRVSSEEGKEERSLCAIGCSQCMQHHVATPHSTGGLWAWWTFDHGFGPPWSTVAIPISRLVARWDPHQCQCQDQHHFGRSSCEVSYNCDEDARQLQDGVGWIHDLVWISSMRSLGLRDRCSAIACCFSAIPVADHAEW